MILLQEILSIGAYFTFIRELRYVLESILQAYYIKKNYSDVSYDGKIAILAEREKLNRNIVNVKEDLKEVWCKMGSILF